ncbi:MAG: Cdc6/Cdc18 family protein [Candidatus Hodarchaeota archaeon]
MHGHCKDPIFKYKEALSPDYLPDHMSNRMEEIKAISQLIYESLEGKTTHILISGPPGTGKTASIKFIFKSLKEDTDALVCYVNCFNKSTKMGALYSMVLGFFKEKRPTRKMLSRRGIAYDELLDSFRKELEKTGTKVVVCLDEVDQLEETELIYDLTRTRWDRGHVQIIAISNNPFVFKDLDPRTKSRLYPLREISFNPYTKEEMKEIVEARVEAAFQEDVVNNEAIDFLAEFTVEKKGDVRIARETLIRAGELARKSGDGKIRVGHIKKNLNKSKHATSRKILGELSKQERFILRLIPKKGTYYPQFYQFYKSTDGRLGDRMLRNYMERFSKLKLINMERKGVSGSYFITLNMPKDVLFEIS